MARSDNWRTVKSAVPGIEGAAILRALEKACHLRGLDTNYKVEFSTEEEYSFIDTDAKRLVVAAGKIWQESPIRGEDMDVLVGLCLHEVEHDVIESWRISSGCPRDIPQPFINIAEDAIIDYRLMADGNVADYHRMALDYFITKKPPIDKSNLAELWTDYSLYHNRMALMDAPPDLLPALNELVEMVERVKTMGAYRTMRQGHYLETWNRVKDVWNRKPPASKPQDNDNGGSQPQDGQGEQPQQDGQPAGDKVSKVPFSRPTGAIKESLAKEVKSATVNDVEDISGEVNAALREIGIRSDVTVVMRRKDGMDFVEPDSELARKLHRILDFKRGKNLRVLTGEMDGKLDMTHLWRASVDKRVFSEKWRFPDGLPRTCVVVDMSSSTNEKSVYEQVLAAAGALAQVVTCRVYGYYGASCCNTYIDKLDDHKRIHKMEPRGWTPSGDALVAVGNTMKRGDLLIHLTDGESNMGICVNDAHKVLEAHGVDVVNVIWGNSVYRLYNGLPTTLIDGLECFPEALHRILAERLGVGGRV